MKKYAKFIALVAITALPACSHEGNYQKSQYPEQENRESAGDREEWREAKLNAMVDDFFDKADTNHDGYISWKEFEAFMHQKFRAADKNHDGKLSRDEVMDMMRSHMARIHERMSEEKESMHDDADEQK